MLMPQHSAHAAHAFDSAQVVPVVTGVSGSAFASQAAQDRPVRLARRYFFRFLGMLLFTFTAAANAQNQQFNLPLPLFQSSAPVQSASVGDRIDSLIVEADAAELASVIEYVARVEWRVEPAGAAHLETSPTTEIDSNSGALRASASVTALQAGTFFVIATGFYDDFGLDAASTVQPRNTALPALADNEVAFTVHVDGASNAEQPSDGLTVNQRTIRTTMQAACDSIDAESEPTPSAQSLRAQCDVLADEGETGTALDRLAAEEIFAIGDSLISSSEVQLSNIYSRLQALRSGSKGPTGSASIALERTQPAFNAVVNALRMRYLKPSALSSETDIHRIDQRLGFFANGSISIGDIDGHGQQQSAGISSQGMTFGADYRVNNAIVVGAGLGLMTHTSDFKADDGNLEATGTSLSLFSTWYESDAGHADLVLSVGQNDFDLRRRLDLPGQTVEFGLGSTSASHASLALSAAKILHKGRWSFGPSVRLQFTRASVGAFSEQSSLGANGSGTTLDVQSHSLRSTRMAIGFDVNRVVNSTRAVFVPLLRIEMEIENERDKGAIAASFTHDPESTTMRLTGTERDERYINVVAGTTMQLVNSISAFLFAESRLQDKFVSQHWLKFGVRAHF